MGHLMHPMGIGGKAQKRAMLGGYGRLSHMLGQGRGDSALRVAGCDEHRFAAMSSVRRFWRPTQPRPCCGQGIAACQRRLQRGLLLLRFSVASGCTEASSRRRSHDASSGSPGRRLSQPFDPAAVPASTSVARNRTQAHVSACDFTSFWSLFRCDSFVVPLWVRLLCYA
jgi:hypothetical protein